MTKALHWGVEPLRAHPARRLAAWALRSAGAALAGLAERVHAPARAADAAAAADEPVLEFHAEAGAPEGALYIDGRLVGHVLGVQRL